MSHIQKAIIERSATPTNLHISHAARTIRTTQGEVRHCPPLQLMPKHVALHCQPLLAHDHLKCKVGTWMLPLSCSRVWWQTPFDGHGPRAAPGLAGTARPSQRSCQHFFV
jgi:hypothetical protein